MVTYRNLEFAHRPEEVIVTTRIPSPPPNYIDGYCYDRNIYNADYPDISDYNEMSLNYYILYSHGTNVRDYMEFIDNVISDEIFARNTNISSSLTLNIMSRCGDIGLVSSHFDVLRIVDYLKPSVMITTDVLSRIVYRVWTGYNLNVDNGYFINR